MRAVIYIRVSTQGQALEEKYSLRAQKEELTAYAKKEKWSVVKIIQDIDKGGKFDKEGLDDLMALADTGEMDIVLVRDQTRLSRLDGIHWEMLKAVLKENNVRLAEPGRMIDLNDDLEEMFSDLQNWFSRRNRKYMSKTMMRGKRQMLREGKAWGQIPHEYMYDEETRDIIKRPGYEWVISMIDDLYLNKKLGLVTISHRLNEVKRVPSGKAWNERLVFDRIRNKAYHGIMEKDFSDGGLISNSDIYPPMRTEETFNKLQEEIKSRSHLSVKKGKGDKMHMLRQVYITCGECERKIGISNHPRRGKDCYYLKHGRKIKMSDQSVCRITINSERFDKTLIMAIKDILTDEEQAKKYIDLDNDPEDLNELRRNLKKISGQLEKEGNKLDKLVDLYLDGSFNKSDLDIKKSEITNEQDRLSQEIERLTSKVNLLEKKQWNYKLISSYFKISKDFDKKLTAVELATMIGGLFPTATLYEDRLTLEASLSNGAPLEVNIPIMDQKEFFLKSRYRVPKN